MGKRNRERRAAKQKQRHRESAGRQHRPPPFGGGGADRHVLREVVAAALLAAADATWRGDQSAAQECAGTLVADFGSDGGELDAAADIALEQVVAAAWTGGWLPLDVYEVARRNLDRGGVTMAVAAVRAQVRQYATAALHPQWRASLAALPESSGDGGGVLRAWTRQHGHGRTTALATAVEVLALLRTLPRLERLFPLPGQARYATAPTQQVDEKALARVRALLAKAESTTFPDEAEALSAKAQELMSRHSLHQALLEHDRGAAPKATGRRLWLEAPYAGAKALLVQAVATANRCRTVWFDRLGFVTILGAEAELRGVELLTTSLLVQANRAMLAAGRQITRSGTSRTRSYRQSFLIAYATRIGERLQQADETSVAEAGVAEAGGSGSGSQAQLLPVLAARSRAADELVDELFPRLTSRSHSVSNVAGWGAGRAAADLAQIRAREAVAG